MLLGMEINQIIGRKQAGESNRRIARETGYDRGTISQVWNRYCGQIARLRETGADVKAIQAEMNQQPAYNASGRRKRKYTPQLHKRLVEILEEEEEKKRRLGARHKQKRTNEQIHEKLVEEGFDIGRVTINNALAKLRKRLPAVYIRQQYDFGERLEYDFGEVMLNCGSGYRKYHMAVFCAPASNFRWAYLYTNQKLAVFQDSHVQFFEMMGGAWGEVVYDNMRNVVHKFIGRHEKQLNRHLLEMSVYYGFRVNVTNCFSGNEKGSVENSVKVLRNKIFAERDAFASFEDAQEYMTGRLTQLNEKSEIAEERKHLLPHRPQLELAEISPKVVNSYSFIHVDTVAYSVPEYLVGQKVIVKKYHDEIQVYADNTLVCTQKRLFGNGKQQVDIYHYLDTLQKKPGAIRNSAALKSIPKLKAIFDTHYAKQPKKFIELFMERRDLPIDKMIAFFEEKINGQSDNRAALNALCIVRPVAQADVAARAQMANYAMLTNAGLAKRTPIAAGAAHIGTANIGTAVAGVR